MVNKGSLGIINTHTRICSNFLTRGRHCVKNNESPWIHYVVYEAQLDDDAPNEELHFIDEGYLSSRHPQIMTFFFTSQ